MLLKQLLGEKGYYEKEISFCTTKQKYFDS